MVDPAKPDEVMLDRLALLQGAIHAAPDDGHLCHTIAEGLGALPGVTSAAVCLEGARFGSASAAALLGCAAGPRCGTAECPAPAAGRVVVLPLRTARRTLGAIALAADPADVARVVPTLQNVADLAALRIEHDRQRAALGEREDVLERRVRERTAALDAERERLAVALASIGDGVIATDARGLVTFLNPIAEALTGWRAADAAGRPVDEVFQLVAETTRTPVPNPVRHVLREAVPTGLRVDNVLVGKDGARPIADTATPFRDAAGRLLGVVLVFRDQTDERCTNQALREITERARAHAAELQAVLDAVPAAVCITRDRRALFVSPNRYGAELLRVPADANVSKSALGGPAAQGFRMLKDGAEIAPELLPVQTAAREGIDVTGVEFDVAFPDGAVRSLAGNAAPLRNALGEVTGAVGAFVDVTEQKRSERRLQALIEKSADMILLVDRDARFRLWSQGATATLGRHAAEMLGTPALELVHPEDRDRVAEALERVLARPGESARSAFRYQHRSGAWRHIEATARNLLEDPAVRGIVVNARDVTEQRVLEAQLLQAQKLEGIGRLAGGVAHDFANLLTVILSCADDLRRELGDGPSAVREDLDEICAAGDRARRLTGQLLAFARKRAVAPIALDLNEAVRSAEKLISRLLGEDVRVQLDLAPDLGRIHADEGQIDQLLVNLAVNARDAMPRGGTLFIGTRARTITADEAREADLVPAEWVHLTVRDTGTGLSPEAKAHLFEPFFTTKEQGKGTGLGLATVYGIVTQAGGHVRVASEVGAGTTFEFSFPRREAAPERAPERDVAPAGGHERVLVVEDDPQVLAVSVKALRSAGYDVIGASHPQRALDLVDANGGADLRLLLTDVVMPSMDGYTLAKELRRRNPGLRVLYLSGYPGDVLAVRGVEDVAEFLAKPFTGPQLLRRVRALLDRPEPARR
jgi:PAS domain S-box-containing protein